MPNPKNLILTFVGIASALVVGNALAESQIQLCIDGYQSSSKGGTLSLDILNGPGATVGANQCTGYLKYSKAESAITITPYFKGYPVTLAAKDGDPTCTDSSVITYENGDTGKPKFTNASGSYTFHTTISNIENLNKDHANFKLINCSITKDD